MPRAAQRAYSEIRASIVDGVFPPGSHLEEESIAEAVGVSRTPVREALRRLASEGFVEFVPHQGAFVPAWTTADYHEIFDLRAILESFAARLAARQISDATLVQLDSLTQEMDALADRMTKSRMDALAELNNEFHSTVVRASGNRRLLQLTRSAVALPLVLRTFQRYSPDRLRRSMQHHREIVAALRAHDENWAEAVMRTHILSARWEVAPPGDDAQDGAGQAELMAWFRSWRTRPPGSCGSPAKPNSPSMRC
jgi:DNA-binding GntR family transcriptional regulator